MREIKFRYIYKVGIDKHIESVILTLAEIESNKYDFSKKDYCELISKDLFTGLKDKNGKEIYKGDIVRLSNHHQSEVVCFEGSAFGVFKHTDKNRDSGLFMNLDEWADNAMEVIGNIYENLELMEKK